MMCSDDGCGSGTDGGDGPRQTDPLNARQVDAYSFMHSTIVHLREGDGESWAINLSGDLAETHRAQKGFGGNFKKVWSVELQSLEQPDYTAVNWDVVLERAVYAFDMNDPLLAEFNWPTKAELRK